MLIKNFVGRVVCFSFMLLVASILGCGGATDGDGDGGGGTTETVSVSGRLSVVGSAVVDGDTNDPTNAVVSNNGEDLTMVQSIPNPATVGGFLGTLAAGTSDQLDVYRVQMAAGQTATLLLADPIANDFDLFLYDEFGSVLDSSEGVGRAEQVTAPTNGVFLIEVSGFSVSTLGDAGGLYTFLVGGAAGNAIFSQRDKLSSLHPAVSGDVVVSYKDRARRSLDRDAAGSFDYEVVNSPVDSGGVGRLRATVRAGGKFASSKRSAAIRKTFLRRPPSETIAAVKELRRHDAVSYAEPNYLRTAFAEPNDEFYSLQWHYPLIGLPAAWDITTGDASVIVSVIDTGVVLSHPDLQGQTVSGYDFISDPSISLDGDGIDADANDVGDKNIQGTKSSFHGTHVAGTIAASSNTLTGVAGIAWNSKIMPIRVLGNGGGTEFDIVQGILFSAGLENSSGTVPADAADIINMSLGGQGFSQAEQDAITSARAAGVIVIAAAGNESDNADLYTPAALDGVVTVSAVGYDRGLAPYSNFGSTVEVAAPGGDTNADKNGDTYPDGILSSLAGDDGTFTYDFYQGTSMAAPHVAGVAALMKSVNPNLGPADFDQLLAGTHAGTSIAIVDDLGATGKDISFGYGMINALGAVRAAAAIAGVETGVGPVIRSVPSSLDLGSDDPNGTLVITNVGAEGLVVSGVTTSETWMTVSPTSGGEGTYPVRVDRTGLADGVYTGTVDFSSNGGSLSVTVRISVGDEVATGGDVGTLYVLVVDVEALASVDQFNAIAAEGYAFSFPSLPAGVYGVFAGTDMDNDTLIDDEGEGLGGFPTLAEVSEVDLTVDRSGLNFGISYLINVQAPSGFRVFGGGASSAELRSSGGGVLRRISD